ncbi:unnamed protein product [Tuber aestivum]|uniref:Transcription factor CBF/NF-Y/archaeal histone domain-containing protein n=1 Tax=Tuber aestivum TaxID=59557 RepID=A0A292PUN4_9PEZI|nr:unnamed protein product [Tuber aestivum]
MSASPSKDLEGEVGVQSPDEQEHMDQPEASQQQPAFDFEVKEQDRWLPIANGMEEDRLPSCICAPTQNHTNPSRCASPVPISALADADIRNFALVARIMKTALPENAKIAKEAKECMQECVSEFISFITSEVVLLEHFAKWSSLHVHLKIEDVFELTNRLISAPPSEKCQQEKRKTVNGEDILFAMTSLGFENYAEALKIYLAKYRESQSQRNQSEGARGGGGGYGGGGNAPPPPGYRRPEGPNAATPPIEGEEHQAGYNDVYGHVAGNGDGPY